MNTVFRFTFIMCLVGQLVFVGCKSTKTLTSAERNLKLSTKEVIKLNSKSAADFKTFQGKVKIEYTQDQKSQAYTVSIRMLKDEIIWINAPFNVIRALITPEKVSFYNKLDNTYFDGDFSYLSDILGTEVDFEKVQNILLGEALFKLDKETYNMSVHNDAYLFQPKEQIALYEIFYVINPSHFKMDSQQLAQPKSKRFLEVDYLSYQEIENQTLPEKIKVIVLEADDETLIELEFKSITLNEDLRYPFTIPSGFDEIILD